MSISRGYGHRLSGSGPFNELTFGSPQVGTVADRIRAFQASQYSEVPPPSASNITSRTLTSSKETTFKTDDGGEKDSGAALLIERHTTVANRHAQTTDTPSFPLPRKQSRRRADKIDQSPRKVSAHTRPSTSMERNTGEQKPAQKPVQPPSRRMSRRHRSMENILAGSSELAGARSRLRSVIDDNEEKPNLQRSRAYTLAELNHMLDNAIEGSVDLDEVLSGSVTSEHTPKTSLHQDQAPISASQHQSLSRERVSRSSLDSVRPRSSGSSEQAMYDDEKNALYWPHLITKGPKKHPHTSHSTRPASTARPIKPVIEPMQPKPIQSRTQFSPVRQRAAMFESLGPMVQVHGEDCGAFQHYHPDNTSFKQKPVATFRKVHKIKFGDIIDERPGTPLIPLTLPQMVSPREAPSPLAQRTDQLEAEAAEKNSNDNTVKHDNDRKSSMGWPFRWSIFNKPASTQPEPEEKAPSDVQSTHRQEHDATKSTVVKNRVQDLLLAAKGRDDVEKKRWELERARMSRRHSRFPPEIAQESTRNEKHVESQKPRSSQPPALSIPSEKQTEATQNFLNVESEATAPITPLQHAMTEKQVLSPMSLPEGMTTTSTSPKKVAPRTPLRGRSRKSTHHLSVNDQERNVEQQFNFSPRPSRSASRTGGGGVKVEVEVRDSPEREARERGEKIVIIRANVEDLVREE